METGRLKENIERLVQALANAHGDILQYSRIPASESAQMVEEAGLSAALLSLQATSTTLLDLIAAMKLESVARQSARSSPAATTAPAEADGASGAVQAPAS